MVESDAVRKALRVVGVGEEMLHGSVDVLLEALAGFLGVDAAGKDREELVAACCAVVKGLNDSLNVPTPQSMGVGSKEEMEIAFNATWTNEQGMLMVGGVTADDKDSVHAYFEEMWAW